MEHPLFFGFQVFISLKHIWRRRFKPRVARENGPLIEALFTQKVPITLMQKTYFRDSNMAATSVACFLEGAAWDMERRSYDATTEDSHSTHANYANHTN